MMLLSLRAVVQGKSGAAAASRAPAARLTTPLDQRTHARGNRNVVDRAHTRSMKPALAIASSLLIYASRSLFSRLGLVTW
jgi:hypothetical protein